MSNSVRKEIEINLKQNTLKDQKSKIVDHAIKVIEKFNLSPMLSAHLSFSLVDNNTYFDDCFSLVIENYSDTKGIVGNAELMFKNIGNPLNFKLGYNQEAKKPDHIKINFDEDQNIKNIVFFFHFNVRNNRFDTTEIHFTFDSAFKLVDYKYESIFFNPSTRSLFRNEILKDEKTSLDLENEVFFINMKLNKQNDVLTDLLPELFIPSAYDFNSLDFQSRFEMIDMVIY